MTFREKPGETSVKTLSQPSGDRDTPGGRDPTTPETQARAFKSASKGRTGRLRLYAEGKLGDKWRRCVGTPTPRSADVPQDNTS